MPKGVSSRGMYSYAESFDGGEPETVAVAVVGPSWRQWRCLDSQCLAQATTVEAVVHSRHCGHQRPVAAAWPRRQATAGNASPDLQGVAE